MNTNDNQALRNYRSSRRFVWTWVAVGTISAIAIGISLVAESTVHIPTTPLAIAMLMAIWAASSTPVRLFADRIEVKSAPLAATRIIRFDAIDKVDRPNPKKVVVHYRDAKGEQKLRLPLHLLGDADRSDLLTRVDRPAPTAA